jgi:16S rRNA (cytidine1402-2'-O)-methyltransferase
MIEIFGNRKAVITRELTKIHEETIRGTLLDIRQHLLDGSIRGEFTVLVHGASEKPLRRDIDTAEYLKNLMLHRGLSKKEAITAAARELGMPKKDVYRESLKI